MFFSHRLKPPTWSALVFGAEMCFRTCNPEIAAGYGESAVDPKFRPRRGVMGVLLVVWVARQYASRYSAKCSQASSSWFSSKITSNISWSQRQSLVHYNVTDEKKEMLNNSHHATPLKLNKQQTEHRDCQRKWYRRVYKGIKSQSSRKSPKPFSEVH